MFGQNLAWNPNQMGGLSLPSSWDSVPGLAGRFGQESTRANQQLGQIFAGGSAGILGQLTNQSNRAVNRLIGTNRANIRGIKRTFAREEGDMLSNLVDAGLGNSTIRGSMQSGLTRAFRDAISGSKAAFGEKLYNAQMQAALAQSGLAQQQLNTWFQGTQIGYPDPNAAFMNASGAGGMGGGGGPTIALDPSRPTGGPQPSWAFYGGGGVDPGVGGGWDPSFFAGSGQGNQYIPTTGEYAQSMAALYAPQGQGNDIIYGA